MSSYGLAGVLESILRCHALGDVAAEEGLDNAVDSTKEDTTLACTHKPRFRTLVDRPMIRSRS
jgi:hypothetical protein